MNGHHESCECQPCTIGREIGMDRALELLEKLSRAARIQHEYGTGESIALRMARNNADAFLKEHGHE